MDPAQPIKRLYERFSSDLPVEIWLSGHKMGEGRMLNVGMGGAFVRCTSLLAEGGMYELRLTVDEHKFAFPGRVARVAGNDPKMKGVHSYGFKFVLTPKHEERLKLLIDKLRRSGRPAQWTDKLEWYWGA